MCKLSKFKIYLYIRKYILWDMYAGRICDERRLLTLETAKSRYILGLYVDQ